MITIKPVADYTSANSRSERLCKNCKYFDGDTGTCSAVVDLVTGERMVAGAYAVRYGASLPHEHLSVQVRSACGQRGTLWEPRSVQAAE